MTLPGPCAEITAHLPTLVWTGGRPQIIMVRHRTCRREMVEEYGAEPYTGRNRIDYDIECPSDERSV